MVTAAPTYHQVQLEAWVVLAPGHDPSEVLRAAADDLGGYLHPLTGGDDRAGVPFGGPLRNVALVTAGCSPSRESRRCRSCRWWWMACGCRRAPITRCGHRPLPWPERPLLVPVPRRRRRGHGGCAVTCADQTATFRLLDPCVGWQPDSDAPGLAGLKDQGGLRLDTATGGLLRDDLVALVR